MCSKLSYLKSFLDESSYTVALCGSGMMEEGGFIGVKSRSGTTRSRPLTAIQPTRYFPAPSTTPGRSCFLSFTKGNAGARAQSHAVQPGHGLSGTSWKAQLRGLQQYLRSGPAGRL